MFNISEETRQKYLNGSTKQIMVLTASHPNTGFSYFFSEDGDIAESGLVIEEYMSADNSIGFGGVPPKTLSVDLINKNYDIGRIGISIIHVECGVLKSFDTSQKIRSTAICEVFMASSIRYYCVEGDGCLYRNGARIIDNRHPDSRITSIIVSSSQIKAYGYDGESKRYYVAFIEGTSATPQITYRYDYSSPWMVEKTKTPHSIRFINGEMRVWTKEGLETYELSSLGDFDVRTNPIADTSRDIYSISNAMNYSAKALESPVSIVIPYLEFPIFAIWYLAERICEACGITPSGLNTMKHLYGTEGEAIYPTIYRDDVAKWDMTCKEALSKIAEASCGYVRAGHSSGSVIRFKRISNAELPVEEVPASRIVAGSVSVSNYKASAPTGLTIKSLNGQTYNRGTTTNKYYVVGNPIVTDASVFSLEDVKELPEYYPIEFEVTEADPSVEVGDMVSISTEDLDFIIQRELGLYDTEDNEVVTENDEAFSYKLPFVFPLMHRTLRWAGKFTATYEAYGEETRKVPNENDYVDYNASVASNKVDQLREDIATTGATTINGGNITTGMIQGGSGQYSVNLDTGEVNMANANITGGSIKIDTSNASDDVINLKYQPTYQQFNEIQITPSGISTQMYNPDAGIDDAIAVKTNGLSGKGTSFRPDNYAEVFGGYALKSYGLSFHTIGGSEFDELLNFYPAVGDQQNIIDLKMLGWTVPTEIGIRNSTDINRTFYQKVGRVDISTLNWAYNGSIFYVYMPEITAASKKGYCVKYNFIQNPTGGWSDIPDNSFRFDVTTVIIKDTRYTNVLQFRDAMVGIYLYYELPTQKYWLMDGHEIANGTYSDYINMRAYNDVGQGLNTMIRTFTPFIVHTFMAITAGGSPNWVSFCIDADGYGAGFCTRYDGMRYNIKIASYNVVLQSI